MLLSKTIFFIHLFTPRKRCLHNWFISLRGCVYTGAKKKKVGGLWWMHPRKDIRGCLHEKTRTGASFIWGWLFDFVSRDDWVILKVHFMLIKIHAWFKIANITHALPVPVYRQNNFTPKSVLVSRLHDTVTRFRTGVKFSPRYNNQGYSGWYDILWWYHVTNVEPWEGTGVN